MNIRRIRYFASLITFGLVCLSVSSCETKKAQVVSADLQKDSKNCGEQGKQCGQNNYCFKGKCIEMPKQKMFCYTEWCMATCEDGFVIRDLCTPCDKSCKDQCGDHGGCKSTCTDFSGQVFEKKCVPNL